MTRRNGKAASIKPDPKNARKHGERNQRIIRQSLEEVGAGRSILLDADGVIRAGNGVYTQAKALGLKVKEVLADGKTLIAVRRKDLRGKKAERAAILDNRAGELAEWDTDVLADLAANDAAALAGLFEERELRELLGDKMPGGKEETADAGELVDKASVLQEKWQVKRGDIWEVGRHRLMCGDSTSAEDVQRLMGGERARLEFSDPPYRMDTVGGGVLKDASQMRAIKANRLDSFEPITLSLLTQTAVFCCNKPLVKDYILLAEGLKVAWDICFWKKGNTPPNFGGHLMTDTEYLMVLGIQSPIKGQEKELYSKAYIGDADDGKLVAWQKPVGLVQKFIRLFSNSGDAVIDRFAGTGSSIVACEQTGRQGRGLEIEPRYVSVCLQRLANLGLTPKRVGRTAD